MEAAMGDFIHFALAGALIWLGFLWWQFGLPALPTVSAQWRYWAFASALGLIGVEHLISALAHVAIAPWEGVGHAALVAFAWLHFRSVLRKGVGGTWWIEGEREIGQ
jgi:hypothetical protein